MLTGIVTLDKLSEEGKLLERRRQPMRCFTKGFLELLYIAHAAITDSSPYLMPNINEDSVDVDSGVYTTNRGKGNLAIASLSGGAGIIIPAGGQYDSSYKRLAAELIGIQVGAGSADVIPTDRHLASRIMHGVDPADTSPVLIEACNTGDNNSTNIYGASWKAQSIMCAGAPMIVSVRLLLGRSGAPGTVTVSLRETDTGPDLASATTDGNTLPTAAPWEWREFTFSVPVQTKYPIHEPGQHRYYMVVRAPDGDSSNYLIWRYSNVNIYPKGYYHYSSNSGASWSSQSDYDLMFEVYRQFANHQLDYGGCEVGNFQVDAVAGIASFELRRHFYNRCGAIVTVSEVGIYAGGTSYGDNRAWPFSIARDVVSPEMNVLDGQVLRVTYVPQIAV